MTRNEGSLDRTLRTVAGGALVLLMLAGVVSGVLGWLSLALGAILLVTGLTGVCPIYAVLGIRTCPAGTSAGGKPS